MSLWDIIAAKSVPPVPAGLLAGEPRKALLEQVGTLSSQGSLLKPATMVATVGKAAPSPIEGAVPAEWIGGCRGLSAMEPPPGWPERNWEMLIFDADRFLREWGEKAAHLGWTAGDLFGADRYAPWQRTDMLGLVPLIAGGQVVLMTADTATIRHRTGNRLRFYRRGSIQAVPIWSLGISNRAGDA
jgi:hypothetical protein